MLGWKSVCVLEPCTLWPILWDSSHHEVAKCSLERGGGWERIGKKEATAAETWSLVQKDSFFQIMHKNRMDVEGERTARKKQCY